MTWQRGGAVLGSGPRTLIHRREVAVVGPRVLSGTCRFEVGGGCGQRAGDATSRCLYL